MTKNASSALRFFGSGFLLTTLLCLPCASSAQELPKPASSTTKRPRQASSTVKRPVSDTAGIYYVFAPAPEKTYTDTDTLPEDRFRMYDPTRRQQTDWAHLGNLGTPARPLLFAEGPRRGFRAGLHGFDLYRMAPEQLRFYRTKRSFSDVFFSQGVNQFDGMLNARFARTFAGGTGFSLDYRTINNRGQFQHLRARHNTLSAGLWIPVGRRYNAFVVFTNNINRQQDNGGIQTDTVFGSDAFSGPISAPVWLSDAATTRYANQYLHLTQHLIFAGTQSGRRVLRATHTFNRIADTYKFSLTPLAEDTDLKFFQLPENAHFLTEKRGLRHYLSVKEWQNTFSLTTFKPKTGSRVSDMLSAGLTHSFFDIWQEPRDTQINNVFAIGKIILSPSERFSFVTEGSLGLLSNTGEYALNGTLMVDLGKAGRLQGSLDSRRYPPSLIQHRMYVTKGLVWDNKFGKIFSNTLSATYALPRAGLEITARTFLTDNYIYFDTKSKPSQLSGALSVSQLSIGENFRLGSFHLDNNFALQQSNRLDTILRLPGWFSKNSLYYAGKWFKSNLDLRIGVDFRINADFRPDAWHPLTGQFYLQDSLRQQPYPWADVFAAFRVKSFRFFFRYENLTYALREAANKPPALYYMTARHPQQFPAFRLGIGWRFSDDNVTTASGEAKKPY